MLTLPNILTLSRIFAVPLLVFLLWKPSWFDYAITFGLYCLVGITDYFDGYLARTQGTVSRLGMFLDPIADKIMVAAVIVMLVSSRNSSGEPIIHSFHIVPALVIPLKVLTDRPGTPAVPPATGYYPSGHTATAAVAYGAATLLLLPLLRSAGARRALLVLCAALNLGVGFGLTRRGYHWPLDVLASWCLGTFLLTSLWLFLGRRLSRSSRRTSAGTPSRRTGPS